MHDYHLSNSPMLSLLLVLKQNKSINKKTGDKHLGVETSIYLLRMENIGNHKVK